jgi:lipopolysaccharide transport system ATP-binding protein
VGHNGAGKSTLLRLLCGVGRPTSGRIVRNGQVHGLLELGSGFHPDLTGRENVLTGGMLSGFTARDVRARLDEIVAFAELEEYVDQPVRTYSSGMYVRLAFSTALHFDPEVLIVDEVLAVGDARFQKKCVDRLHTFRAQGGTLLLASHANDHIRTLCDEVLVLEEGTVALHADPRSALDRYNELMTARTQRRAAALGVEEPAKPETPTMQGYREGTQEATVTAVRLLEAGGNGSHGITSGADLEVEIAYQLQRPIADMAVVMAIWQGDETKCVDTVVPSVMKQLGRMPADGILSCRVPELRLLPGTYFLTVGLYPPDFDFTYDYHWKMHPLVVVASGPVAPNLSGVLAVTPAWSIAEGR